MLSYNKALTTDLLQFRSLGGTIGLAQCFTVLNAKVRAHFISLPASAFEAAGLSPESVSSIGSSDLSSTDAISNLPPAAQELVRNAFRNGVRWSFISMIPWTALAFIAVLFLSEISDENIRARASHGDKAESTVVEENEKPSDKAASGRLDA
jgi:hypothetical protein